MSLFDWFIEFGFRLCSSLVVIVLFTVHNNSELGDLISGSHGSKLIAYSTRQTENVILVVC